jgi:hypothetical protein
MTDDKLLFKLVDGKSTRSLKPLLPAAFWIRIPIDFGPLDPDPADKLKEIPLSVTIIITVPYFM